MRCLIGSGQNDVEKTLKNKGFTRRDFMKLCAAVSAAMAADASFTPAAVAAALTAKRPPVVWLQFAECTGCTESILRTVDPPIADVLFDVISLDYHETIMQCAGEAIEEVLEKTIHDYAGKFVLVCEGGIPTKDGGIYGKVGGKTMLSIVKDVYPKAAATICIGTCSCFGGVQKAKPNPTGAKGVPEALGTTKNIINIAGCPPNPINFVGAVVHYITKGVPELDANLRPKLFFGESVHDHCPRLKHFEAGEFAKSFDDVTAKKGYCLYELGCKGPDTYNNCPTALFNQVSFPIQAGHPCIGCSEPDFWDKMSPFYETA